MRRVGARTISQNAPIFQSCIVQLYQFLISSIYFPISGGIMLASSYRGNICVAAGGRTSVWAGGGAGGGAGRPPGPGQNINIAPHLSQGGHHGYIMATPWALCNHRDNWGHNSHDTSASYLAVHSKDEIIFLVVDVLIYLARRINIRFSRVKA